MNGRSSMSMAFPRPGPALWAILGATAALGVFIAFVGTWASASVANQVFSALTCVVDRPFAQPWRIVTSGLLTDPTRWSHLLFSLAGLYFLSGSLERRWGPWRLIRFYAASVILGNLVTIAASLASPADAQARFHPEFVYGPMAVITGIAVAWSREFHHSTVNLFLVLPVRATALLWVTIGFCVLDLVYPVGLPEGIVAPFGGVIAGLLFGGSPSLARSLWLRLRLAVLHRRAEGLRVDDILTPKAKRRPRSGAPALRIVPGGDDALKKRTPPKDKRFLN